jgi:YfiH family protein
MSFQPFPNCNKLIGGLSERADGPMNLKSEINDQSEVYESNRRKFLVRHGVQQAVFAVSYHQAKVVKVGVGDLGRKIEHADGLVAKEAGMVVALTVADCVPVYLYDPQTQAFGLLHAGWRGIEAGVIGQGIMAMKENFGSQAGNILLSTGPAIQPCHFEVKADVLEKFISYPARIVKRFNATFLDLPGIIRQQAEQLGLAANHIKISKLCTFCLNLQYFSYRRDHDLPIKTMLAYIGLVG